MSNITLTQKKVLIEQTIKNLKQLNDEHNYRQHFSLVINDLYVDLQKINKEIVIYENGLEFENFDDAVNYLVQNKTLSEIEHAISVTEMMLSNKIPLHSLDEQKHDLEPLKQKLYNLRCAESILIKRTNGTV